jgi:mannose-6-phosphate isomerase-like protein (cupin superfamily)
MKKIVLIALVLGMSHQVVGGEKKAHPNSATLTVAPTWLHRYLPDIPVKIVDISTAGCRYQPIFGAGDSEAGIVESVARYGEVTVEPNVSCKNVSYPREEQIYLILSGSGLVNYDGQTILMPKDEFIYIPPGITHGISNTSRNPCRLIIMGFRIPPGTPISIPQKPQLANMRDVREQTDVGHPTSVRYRLLLGNRKGTNDKLDCGIVVTSLFWMDFAPAGTNFPHRHPIAEELYLVLDGHGLMVAGGGMDGVEGFHPAKAGDAYFFRPNCTVGFYDSKGGRAHILAVRSWVPIPKRDYEN